MAGKFIDVQRDIEGVFGQKSWTDRKIQAFPSNYQGGSYSEEFVKIELVPARPLTNYGHLGVAGQFIIQIYTQAGEGLTRSLEIADILDSEIQAKHLPRGTQTGTSSLSFLGVDNADNSLHRTDYVVSFRNYN